MAILAGGLARNAQSLALVLVPSHRRARPDRRVPARGVAAAPRAIRGSRGISQLSAKVRKQLGKDVGDTVRVTVAPR